MHVCNVYASSPCTIHCTTNAKYDDLIQFHHCSSYPANRSAVPEIIDPVFAKTSQNARFLLSENERFGLVFVKTGSINSGTEVREYAVQQ
jgi:hypothetical protein